jgi:hypothetical protein
MKARGGLTILVCAMALAMPTSTAAKPGYGVSLPYESFSAQLPKSNGYKVSLGTFRNWVEIVLYRRDELAIYLAKGKVNRDRIDADFGSFGRVHLHFSGHPLEGEPLFPGCRGQRPIEARGRLDGEIRFRGEDNFATVSRDRAKASYERGFREVC